MRPPSLSPDRVHARAERRNGRIGPVSARAGVATGRSAAISADSDMVEIKMREPSSTRKSRPCQPKRFADSPSRNGRRESGSGSEGAVPAVDPHQRAHAIVCDGDGVSKGCNATSKTSSTRVNLSIRKCGPRLAHLPPKPWRIGGMLGERTRRPPALNSRPYWPGGRRMTRGGVASRSAAACRLSAAS
jgi:hypothetical protein